MKLLYGWGWITFHNINILNIFQSFNASSEENRLVFANPDDTTRWNYIKNFDFVEGYQGYPPHSILICTLKNGLDVRNLSSNPLL